MDKRTQEYFDKLIAKSPESLTTDEIAFLRARISYFKKAQLEEYDGILNPKAEVKVEEVAPLTRKELEVKALELGIKDPENKKLYPKNSDLASAIEAQAKPPTTETVKQDHDDTK